VSRKTLASGERVRLCAFEWYWRNLRVLWGPLPRAIGGPWPLGEAMLPNQCVLGVPRGSQVHTLARLWVLDCFRRCDVAGRDGGRGCPCDSGGHLLKGL
jgi:hypothetical protein